MNSNQDGLTDPQTRQSVEPTVKDLLIHYYPHGRQWYEKNGGYWRL